MNLVRTSLAVFLMFLPRLAGASPRASGEAKAKASSLPAKDPPLESQSQQPSPHPYVSPASEEARYARGSAFDQGIPVMAALGFSSNDLEIGLGVRAGKTLSNPNHLYVGGTFVYHLGHEVATAQVPGYTASASISAFCIGPEVGYDFDISSVRVRVYSGIGIVWINASTETSAPGIPTVSAHASTDKFVIWPGATVLYPLTDSSFFIGGDLRFVTVPGGPAVGLFALAGTRF